MVFGRYLIKDCIEKVRDPAYWGNNLLDGKESVSYTHLDVYKRQDFLYHYRNGQDVPLGYQGISYTCIP